VSLLTIEDLRVDYVRGDGSATSALAEVSLSMKDGEVLGLVGESGCGKSTLAAAVMGLLPREACVSGSIRFQSSQLETLPQQEFRRLRGDRMSMIVQDPLSALDPAFSIGSQIAETIRAHRDVSKSAARARAIELLTEVGVPGAAGRYRDPPHRFSGGMRQRVVIATAIANDPALLIADEPTTALDATTQAQILALLADLRKRHGTAMLLITHDLGVVAQTCHRVGVLYAGQLVEIAPVKELFANPRHPYTRTLIAALPSMDAERHALPVLEGTLPDLKEPPPGCRFAPRCPHAMPECAVRPALAGNEHRVACWLDPVSRSASAGATTGDGAAAPEEALT
jgi:oligopeptide/dipeptide ABC transporter ATP-binding protein